jgi:hypothetical protein
MPVSPLPKTQTVITFLSLARSLSRSRNGAPQRIPDGVQGEESVKRDKFWSESAPTGVMGEKREKG